MPSTPAVLDEARQLIQSRLADLEDKRKRLERALAELGGKAPSRRTRVVHAEANPAPKPPPAHPRPPVAANAVAAPAPRRRSS